MGIVERTTKRGWKTLLDAEFASRESLEQFNGTTFCYSGEKCEPKDDNDKNGHPKFSQEWPYNSYVSDAVIKQQLLNDLSFWAGTVYDIHNEHWGELVFDGIFPVVGNLLGSFLGRRKRKKKQGDSDHNNLEPAGCGPIAVLMLLWYFRNYPCIKNAYSGIETIQNSYDPNDSRNSTLEKIMKKIWNENLVIIKNIDYNGTSSKIKLDSLPLKKMRSDVSDNSSYEAICKAVFEAIVLNRVPVLIAFESHYAILSGVKFEYSKYCSTKSFYDSMKIYPNLGWGRGPVGPYTIDKLKNGKIYNIKCLYFYAPTDVISYTYVNDPEAATTTEKNLAIRRRKEFDALVGNNYEKVPSVNCKYRKGEVVYVDYKTPIIGRRLGVIVSKCLVNDQNIQYYKISYATQEIEDTTNRLSTYNILQNRVYSIPIDYLQKVFSKTLDCVFFRETNRILANAQVYVNKYAVGQYIYDEPTLINKSNFLGLGAAYISKIYADTSCDIYFPDRKKTFHSAICFGDDYVEYYNIPSTAQIPAKFEKGEVVYFKDNNAGGTIYKTTISSTEMFVVGLQRTYLVKNAGGITIQVGESALYKIVHTYNYSAY